jgi:DnaJ-class molecular chaperone
VSADDQAEIPCPACRATGEVISNLGGTEQRVPCPWCEGTGRFVRGHDAQARWREAERPEPEPPAAA